VVLCTAGVFVNPFGARYDGEGPGLEVHRAGRKHCDSDQTLDERGIDRHLAVFAHSATLLHDL
jgi:hypothetical protein